MLRWMCGIMLQDSVPCEGLRERLGLDNIISVVNTVAKQVVMVLACTVGRRQ